MLKTLNLWLGGAVLVLTLFVFGASGQAADGTMTWKGSYAYIDGRPPVPFTLTLTANGKEITGRIVEEATFGDGKSPTLSANVVGTSFGYEVTFTKTYDGTGGQTHTVNYRGTIDGKTMFGFWQVGDQDVGAWYATRSPQ
jgi:hypothetical protein